MGNVPSIDKVEFKLAKVTMILTVVLAQWHQGQKSFGAPF